MSTIRHYSAGRFSIEVDGHEVGNAEAVAGGQAFGTVSAEPAGQDGLVHKHIASVAYEELVLTVGADMADDFYDWVSSVFKTERGPRDGAVSFQDYTVRRSSVCHGSTVRSHRSSSRPWTPHRRNTLA